MLNTRLIKNIENEMNKKPRKKKEKEIFELPKQYIKGLSKKEAKEKTENVKNTKELLKEGKKKEARELAKKRPTTKQKKQSSFTERFKKKFPNTKPETLDFAKKTGIPIKAQKDIIKRGMGAFLSAGSRASVSSPRQWGIARLYSFYFNKGQTFDTDLVKKYNITFK
tara:strand:+ start:2814 stop:3314 length:501 start_codon:yes stop_codon:yes gene_type:complete